MIQRLEPRGPEITDEGCAVHRQVRPDWLDHDGQPSSQVFRCVAEDNGMLSLADGRKQSARQACEFHTQTLSYASLGSLTVKVKDFHELELKVGVFEDRMILVEDGVDNEAHAVADYRTIGRSQQRRISLTLLLRAGDYSYSPS